MADVEELKKALMAAHNAGDTDNAKILAKAISDMQRSATNEQSVINEYNSASSWKKPLIALDDIVRLGADGATFGFADKASAGLNSLFSDKSYGDLLKDERKATEDARIRSGGAGVVSEILGGVVTGSAAAKGGITTARFIPKDAGILSRLGLATLFGGAEGSAYGALDAAGHDRDIKQGAKEGMITGAVASPVVEGASSLINRGVNYLKGVDNKIPSLEDLKFAKDSAYADVADRGVTVPGDEYQKWSTGLSLDMTANPHGGVRPIRHPMSSDMLDQLNEATGVNKYNARPLPQSLYDLDVARQAISNDIIRPPGPERYFGEKMQQSLDKFVDQAPSFAGSSAKRGTVQEGVDALKDARIKNSRLQKSNELSDIVEQSRRKADMKALAGSTAGNVKSKISQILDNGAIGYSPEEIGLMDRIVRGTRGGNAARSGAATLRTVTGRAGAGAVGSFGATAVGIDPYLGAGGGVVAGEMLAKGLDKLSDRSTNALMDKLRYLSATGKEMQPLYEGTITSGAKSTATRTAIETDRRRKRKKSNDS